MALVEAIAGILIIYSALNDVFASVVVPRPTPARYRPAGLFIRATWALWRIGVDPSGEQGERRLGIFAPLVLISVVGVWIFMLLLGFGLLFLSLGDEVKPPLSDLHTAIWTAGSAFTTIGYSDRELQGGPIRTLALLSAVTGLGVVAITITYLFSLYASLERREIAVTTLDARAGAPPSGVRLLEETARSGSLADLPGIFTTWETWAAHVLDTHQAYPILAYFRSSHDRESWVSALGALLDAATLVLTTIEGGPRGPATFMRGTGAHVVEDLTRVFHLDADGDPYVERSEFDDAYGRLAAAGYTLRNADVAWAEFSSARAQYASGLSALARHFAVPPAMWISDRSVLPHRA